MIQKMDSKLYITLLASSQQSEPWDFNEIMWTCFLGIATQNYKHKQSFSNSLTDCHTFIDVFAFHIGIWLTFLLFIHFLL